MVPILAVAAIFILRDVNKRGKRSLMSTVTIDKSGPTRKVKYGSMSREPRLGAALVVCLPERCLRSSR